MSDGCPVSNGCPASPTKAAAASLEAAAPSLEVAVVDSACSCLYWQAETESVIDDTQMQIWVIVMVAFLCNLSYRLPRLPTRLLYRLLMAIARASLGPGQGRRHQQALHSLQGVRRPNWSYAGFLARLRLAADTVAGGDGCS